MKNGSTTRKINHSIDKRQNQTRIDKKVGLLDLPAYKMRIPIDMWYVPILCYFLHQNVFLQFPLNWFRAIFVPFKGQRFRSFCSGVRLGILVYIQFKMPLLHIFIMNWKYYTHHCAMCSILPPASRTSYFPWSEQLLAGLFWITLTLPGNFPQNFRWTHLHPSKRWVIISKKGSMLS